MRMLKRFFYVAAIASGLTVSAFAQTQTGGQTGQNGGGLGGGGLGGGGGGTVGILAFAEVPRAETELIIRCFWHNRWPGWLRI